MIHIGGSSPWEAESKPRASGDDPIIGLPEPEEDE